MSWRQFRDGVRGTAQRAFQVANAGAVAERAHVHADGTQFVRHGGIGGRALRHDDVIRVRDDLLAAGAHASHESVLDAHVANARVEGDAVAFDVDGSELVVDAHNVDKARLVPDWVALGLAPARDKSGRDARPGKQKKPTR